MNLSKVIIIDTFGDGNTVAEYTTIEEIEKVFKSNSPASASVSLVPTSKKNRNPHEIASCLAMT
jgi:hypothetical protein